MHIPSTLTLRTERAARMAEPKNTTRGGSKKGRKLSAETRAKMSASRKGTKRSPETCARIRASQKLLPHKCSCDLPGCKTCKSRRKSRRHRDRLEQGLVRPAPPRRPKAERSPRQNAPEKPKRLVLSAQERRAKYLAGKAQYRNRYPERIRGQHRAWRAKNKDHVQAKSREWTQKNPAKRKAIANAWAKANPENRAATSAVRRARSKEAASDPARDIARYFSWVRAARKVRCYWCRKLTIASERHVDHIIALAVGGSNTVANFCCSCARCNQSKNAKLPEDFSGQAEFRF